MSKHLITPDQQQCVWLVDASIYVFRAWFVRGDTPYDLNHKPINAVRGFLRFVYQLLSEQQPQRLAFAFDTHLQTSARKTLYSAYKANRSAAPEELKYQFQLCRAFISALGLTESASQHHEADDLIGSWAKQQRSAERQIIILSGDKDLAQLVQQTDLWWDFGRRKPLTDGGIKTHFGVWPQQIADQLALAGDKADNIPGVPGIGMATAAKLLKRFGDIDQLLANIPLIGSMQVRGAKRLQQLITEHQDTIRLARQLTQINCQINDLPDDLRRQPKQTEKLAQLCEQLQLSEAQYKQWLAL